MTNRGMSGKTRVSYVPFVDFSHKWSFVVGKNRNVAFTNGGYIK